MDRRTFMKLLGGLASMPIVGKLAKPLKSETVQEGIASISEGGMKLYEMVVAKVIKEGKKIGESGRVDSYKHPDRPDITVDVNQTDGSAEIYFDTDRGSKGFAEIRRDPESGGDELIEAEEVYKFFGKDGEDYVKDVEEGITGGIENLRDFTKKAMGGRVGYQTGGQAYDPRASALDFATALEKVGAGTAAQKSKSLSNYIQTLTPKSAPPALASAAQFVQGILGVDLGTPQTKSMTNFLQKTIQDKIAQSGKLSGSIDYRDYGVKTGPKGQHIYGKGDVSFNSPEFALATTLGKADYTVDPKTGKVTFTGGTAYDFPEKSLPFGLAPFISKGGFFGDKALDYSPDVALGSDFMKKFNQPKYPDYKTAALQSQYYKNNPSSLDLDLFRAAYARALPNSGIKTKVLSDGQVYTDYGSYDPSRVYSAYMSDRGTSSSNPFFDQFKGSQYADMPAIMKAMYGAPGNLNPYYKDGGAVDLTIITMPDISGSGVESLFKTR